MTNTVVNIDSSTVDASTTLCTIRVIDGQIALDLPDDLSEVEGPSHFTEFLDSTEAESLSRALPVKSRVRVAALLKHHSSHLEQAEREAQRRADNIASKRADAARSEASFKAPHP